MTAVMIAIIQPMTGMPMIATQISRLLMIVDNAILAIDEFKTREVLLIFQVTLFKQTMRQFQA